MNERIKRLRTQSRTAVPTVSLERALLITEFYNNEEIQKHSTPVARAKAFEYILRNKEILINEGDDEEPFTFSALPIDEMAFEESPNGRLENFWRTKEYTIREIKRLWPTAELPLELNATADNNPDNSARKIRS